MNHASFLSRIASVLVLSGLVQSGCEDSPASCEDGDRSYPDGAHWTCSDGCNFCGCNDGSVSTTAILCPTLPGPAAGKLQCESKEDSFWYVHGDTWTCGDCDTCTCSDGETLVQEGVCNEGGGAG